MGVGIYTRSRDKHHVVEIYSVGGSGEGALKVFAHPKPPVWLILSHCRGVLKKVWNEGALGHLQHQITILGDVI